MAYLSKFKTISNSSAAIILFSAWYMSAAITTLVFDGRLREVAGYMLLAFACVLLCMTIVFLVSRIMRRVDVIDAAWGPAFIVAAVTALFVSPHAPTFGLNVQTAVTVLVCIWALRLSATIAARIRRTTEDKRYTELRKQWKGGRGAVAIFLRIFVVQALLATIISIAVIHINTSPVMTIGAYGMIGVTLWLIGFVFEVIADFQLQRFVKSGNGGKLLTGGVRRYSRHPNYFGEALMWWGVFLIALQTPRGWMGIITPLVITYLLLFISGVPLAEKSLAKKPGWVSYKRRTSVFIPLPPRV